MRLWMTVEQGSSFEINVMGPEVFERVVQFDADLLGRLEANVIILRKNLIQNQPGLRAALGRADLSP